jgi:oxygen-independent coproporphyrinogen-3 oxidase
VNAYSPVQSYLDVLFREIDLVADALPPGHPVTHIHWGGGSPTMLKPHDIARLTQHLRQRFAVSPDVEFAIEIDPRGFAEEVADALAQAGVTRASIGVQDCDPAVQRAVNRIQPEETTVRAVELLRSRGINRLNIDLIYGLPYQTLAGLARNVEFAASLDPDRLAVFGYAHVPHFKKHQKLLPEHALPDERGRLKQAVLVNAALTSRGYVPIGLDHFAKPDDALVVAQRAHSLARNFQGYTTDAAPILIGLGASSIGSLPQGYVQNHIDVRAYRAAVAEGLLPVVRGIVLDDDDRMRRAISERLMCDMEADLGAIAACYGRGMNDLAGSLARLAPLLEDGIAQLEGSRLTVNPQWHIFVRLVCAAFDSYLEDANAMHAKAV